MILSLSLPRGIERLPSFEPVQFLSDLLELVFEPRLKIMTEVDEEVQCCGSGQVGFIDLVQLTTHGELHPIAAVIFCGYACRNGLLLLC